MFPQVWLYLHWLAQLKCLMQPRLYTLTSKKSHPLAQVCHEHPVCKNYNPSLTLTITQSPVHSSNGKWKRGLLLCTLVSLNTNTKETRTQRRAQCEQSIKSFSLKTVWEAVCKWSEETKKLGRWQYVSKVLQKFGLSHVWIIFIYKFLFRQEIPPCSPLLPLGIDF